MQVVGYETAVAGDGPALLIAEDGTVRRRGLSAGGELTFALGDRRCAGTVDGRVHRACDSPKGPFCDRHADTWVCARCTGECLKAEMDCHQEHAIYLAAFAPDLVKVGVTRRAPEIRLREQGADRGAHVRTVPDGRTARRIEASLPVPDRVRVPAKIDGFSRPVDADAWERRLEAFDPIERYRFDYGLDLEAVPVRETLASGTVRGTKGRVLVLDAGGTTYAVDMRDLVGYELEEGSSAPDRQASLRAFG